MTTPLEDYYNSLEMFKIRTSLKGLELRKEFEEFYYKEEDKRYKGTLPSRETVVFIARLILQIEQCREGRIQESYEPTVDRKHAERFLSGKMSKTVFLSLI